MLHTSPAAIKDLFKTAYQQQPFASWCKKHKIIGALEPPVVRSYCLGCLQAAKWVIARFDKVVEHAQAKHPGGNEALIRRSALYLILAAAGAHLVSAVEAKVIEYGMSPDLFHADAVFVRCLDSEALNLVLAAAWELCVARYLYPVHCCKWSLPFIRCLNDNQASLMCQ